MTRQGMAEALLARRRQFAALRFGGVLQRSLLRHATPASPLREAHDDIRPALARA